jgi:3-oxoacyl-[acyl-carrier protein] reductase
MLLRDKVAVVTGGSRGIGRAIAVALGREGARVAVNYLQDARAAEETARMVRNTGTLALTVQADVADEGHVDRLFQTVIEAWEGVDILINNAGVCRFQPWESITTAEWDQTMAINLRSVFLCCKRAVPELRRRGGGRIVNVSSVAGQTGGITTPLHYATSKGGELALTNSLARLLAPEHILVNAVAPGGIDTDLLDGLGDRGKERLAQAIPLSRLGLPEEVASAVVYLCSPGAAFITGECIDINGGIFIN